MRKLDLRAAIADARTERAKAVEQLEHASADIEALDAEIKGLELAIARHSGSPMPPSLAPEEQRRWKEMKRTDAVIEILNSVEEPQSPIKITTGLLNVGRTDERNAVAAAIQYLKREQRVHSIGRGKWVAGPEPGSSWETASDDVEDGAP